MTTQSTTHWRLKGTILLSCNCDYGCPCNFNAMPTEGHCEGGWTWHVDEGVYGASRFDGLNFSMIGDWPRAIHHGNGEVLLLVDERASEAQRAAIAALLAGKLGGPWGILSATITTYYGPHPVPYEVELNGAHSKVQAGPKLRLEMEPIRNPVSGADAFPQVVLPQGFVFKEADLASSRVFQVVMREGVRLESHGKYSAIAPFEYTGP